MNRLLRHWREGTALALLGALAAAAAGLQPRALTLSGDLQAWVQALLWVSLYLGGVGAGARRRRRHQDRAPLPAAGESLLVLHASQTGHAEQLAEHSAASLRAAGITSRALSLAQLDLDQLAAQRVLLLVLSTTGEGDAPDSAAALVAAMERPVMADLGRLRYGLLALGDRDYTQFCAFGRRVDAWLRRAGAVPLFDAIEVDNGDPGALRHWQHQLRELAGAPELPDWEAPRYQRWMLVERRLLNPGSLGGAVYHLALLPQDPADLVWQPGDVAEIGPRHAEGATRQWLQQRGLDPALRVDHGGETASLQDWLARSHWPDAWSPGGDPLALVAGLQPLPHREYSIASLPGEGRLQLLLRQARRDDGTLGLGSGWLTGHAPLGAEIALRVRRNSQFHLPDDDRPLLLIGNGTGIAGLRALLAARVQRGHTRNWLLFGERQPGVDAFYGDELQAWLAAGMLQRLDLVWSRIGGTERYVQQRLLGEAARVRAWVADDAAIHVCGSLDGMAAGVDAALGEILGAAALARLRESGGYRRDVY
jgi:sulfite reductase (NADPH) flavoprotein alpha-component